MEMVMKIELDIQCAKKKRIQGLLKNLKYIIKIIKPLKKQTNRKTPLEPTCERDQWMIS